MRHDVKYPPSYSAPVRQRPGDSSEYNNFYYQHGNHNRASNNGFHGASQVGGSSSSSNGADASGASVYGSNDGGTVSALSGSEFHESQKQWEWLDDVLAKSSQNKETVSMTTYIYI